MAGRTGGRSSQVLKVLQVQELQLQPFQNITPPSPPPDVQASVSCFERCSCNSRLKELFSRSSRPRATALTSASCGMRTICWPGMFRDRPRRAETKSHHVLQPSALLLCFQAPGSGRVQKEYRCFQAYLKYCEANSQHDDLCGQKSGGGNLRFAFSPFSPVPPGRRCVSRHGSKPFCGCRPPARGAGNLSLKKSWVAPCS